MEKLFLWGVLASVLAIVGSRRHLLSILLLLEIFLFSLLVGSVFVGGLLNFFSFSLMILGVGACEAAVGLGMLIGFARVKGSDLVSVGLVLKS
uniref:NADH dehydrogenase subunit 4L n=1 Tax=Pillucina pisidium (Dunker, 1860) TaxID=244488 RepID=UPI00233EB344|nr:NADH dehydrogenase subunit 4L [Pillucina pisidium (Dunker, 1860)]WBR65407.1 NADH dehydrogenase subunit 4L [Pillucina pisidium (Dunker, 1860)]